MRIKILSLIVLILSSGCVIRNEIDQIHDKLDRIDSSNRRVEDAIARLDSLSEEEVELIMKFRAEQGGKLNQIEYDVESTRNAVNELSGIKVSPLKDTTILSDVYSIAYSDYLQGNYELAISGFLTYLNSIPNLDEARYLLGECYFETTDYINSIRTFETLLQSFPKSKRVPISLYRIGNIHEIMGDTVSANHFYDVLLENYPDSEESKLLLGEE